MVRRCHDFGRDLARGPVEVQPTTHFMMGGVVSDPSCRTAIEGLFVAGEDAGGLNLTNQAAVARLIVASALGRRKSHGVHYRSDFPSADPGLLYTVRVRRGDSGPCLHRAPVALTRLAPRRVGETSGPSRPPKAQHRD